MLTEDLRYLEEVLEVPRKNLFLIGAKADYLTEYHDHPRENCFSSENLLPAPATPSGSPQPFRGYRDLLTRAAREAFGRDSDGSASPPSPANTHSGMQLLGTCDAALVTGGGTLNTRDAEGQSLRRMHHHLRCFREAGLPVFMSGQTFGPLGLHDVHDQLAREVVDMVDVLTTRDGLYSRRYLEMIGAEPKEHLETYDDACTLPWEEAALPEESSAFLAEGNVVAVNVTHYTADSSEKRALMAELCEHVVGTLGKRVVLLSHAPWDYPHLHVIRDSVANACKEAIHLPDTRLWRGEMLKKAISQCDAALGGRYHFIVFAGTSGTPFVGMTGNHYSYVKQDGFARPLGLSDFILTEKESTQLEVIKARLDEALEAGLDLDDRFSFPSESMTRFGEWLAALQTA